MMNDIGYFYEWVAQGAAFGIKAFFAVFVFALVCLAVLGLLSLIASVFGGGKE
jgi:hypothetical protein